MITYEQGGRVIELKPAAEQRLWRSIDESDGGCWNWTGRLDRDGYGTFKANKATISRAHRVTYQTL
ncbi:MAG: hypothetical protein WCC60_06615, partial [Ilumatobacteraceae bacterium]